MESKIMQIFYGNDCLPYKDKDRVVHYPIVGSAFQGASLTTEIRFYVDRIGGDENTWVAISKLPNGKVGSKVLNMSFDYDLNEHYVALSLSSFYTQAKGDLYISLQGYDGGITLDLDDETDIYSLHGTPVIQATGSVKIAINYATQVVGSDEFEEITIQELLAYIGGKLGKDNNNYLKVITNNDGETFSQTINSDKYADYLRSGDVVYSKDNKKFYTLSGTHPSLSYAEITFEFGGLKLGSLEVSSSLKVYTFADIVNDDGLTLPEMVAAYIAAADDTYVTLTTEQVITGKKTFTGLNVYKTGDTLYGNVMPSTSGYTANRTLATENYVTDYAYSKSQVYTKEETYAKEDVYTKAQTYSQAQVDEIVASIKANQFKVVDSLPPVGENGIIYLVPISGGQGYTQYIWQSGSYISLGDTTVDLSNYYTQAQTNSLLAQKQDDVCLSIVSGKLCITYVE